jgi:hypothetical protein
VEIEAIVTRLYRTGKSAAPEPGEALAQDTLEEAG